ncbi:MAG: nucleotidyl transferase AbiEii/AbiGii toxin family protein [Defluviitaleaceae bacterium]|nr:nucleotidyl transferase AbiEii/AbiGii toxin family protein [Defluviitaleaceae bacterium]
MDDFPISNSFSDDDIEIWDVLVDIARTLTQSKYNDDFRMKGMFVLASYLKGRIEGRYIRGTQDIDMDFSNIDSWLMLSKEIDTLLTDNSRLGIVYKPKLNKVLRENKRSGRIGLECLYKGKVIKTHIDMNVRTLGTGHYFESDINFSATSLYVSLCDKISVITDDIGIQKRVKDLYDIYLISLTFDCDMRILKEEWILRGRSLNVPIALLNPEVLPNVIYAYDKYSGIPEDLAFQKVYDRVVEFLEPILEHIQGYKKCLGYVWSSEKGAWIW